MELLGHVVIPIWSFQIYIYIYIVDLQCCVNFCWAAKWLTYVLRSVVQPCPMLHLHGLCSPPSSSSVHGILQARILEWVAVSSSRGSSCPRDQTCVSLAGRFFTTVSPYIYIYIYIYVLLNIVFHYTSSQDIEYDYLCNTVGYYCPSIPCVIVCLYWPQTVSPPLLSISNIFNFFKNHQTVLPSGCVILHSYMNVWGFKVLLFSATFIIF